MRSLLLLLPLLLLLLLLVFTVYTALYSLNPPINIPRLRRPRPDRAPAFAARVRLCRRALAFAVAPWVKLKMASRTFCCYIANTHVFFYCRRLTFPKTSKYQQPWAMNIINNNVTTCGHELLWINSMASQKVSLCPSDLRLCMSVFQAIQKTRYLKYSCPIRKLMQSNPISVLRSELHNFRLVLEHMINNSVSHTYFFIQQTILLPKLGA